MTEEMLRRDIKDEVDSKHTTTDAEVNDAESKLKTDIAAKHTTTDTLIDSKHTTTDANVDDAESKLKTDIAAKHTTTDTLIGSKHTTTDTLIGSKHDTTQSKIATVGAKVGTQLALIKRYLAHGTAELTADPTIQTEDAGVANGTAWELMATKVIDGPESETKTLKSVFIDLGWKHKSGNETNPVYTKWVASSLASGTGIAATAPDLTDSILSPSTTLTSVHRSGAVKLAGMTTLPLKMALVAKASGVSNSVAASIMSDSVVELEYTI